MRKAKQIPLFSVSVISSAISALVLVACGGGANEDPAYMRTDGKWNDTSTTISTTNYVVEWDANEVLSNFINKKF